MGPTQRCAPQRSTSSPRPPTPAPTPSSNAAGAPHTTPQEELRHLNALVDTPDPASFDRAVQLALSEVRTQNAPYLLRRAIAHPTLGAHAWRTVSSAWDVVTERFPDNSLPRMLEGIRGLSDTGVAREVESFVARHPVSSGDRIVAQHIERMWVTVVAADRVRSELGAGG